MNILARVLDAKLRRHATDDCEELNEVDEEYTEDLGVSGDDDDSEKFNRVDSLFGEQLEFDETGGFNKIVKNIN